MTSADPALARLAEHVARGEGAHAEREIGRLLADDASPWLWRTIRNQLPDLDQGEQEELHGDALLRLTVVLQRFAAGDPEIRIDSFRAYVNATAVNGCRAFLRARNPERTRLQNQLRYVLRHDRELALWEADDGTPRCGLASWRDRDESQFPPELAPSARPAAYDPGFASLTPGALPAALRRYFLWRGRPVPFAQLTSDLAIAFGVRDLPAMSLSPVSGDGQEPEVDSAPELAEQRPDVQTALEDREFLVRLWSEVQDLPRGQRAALLLNLRDDQGRDRLRLFPVTGVAALPALARSLELSVTELERLWERLPLDDRSIADLLQLTQRQVINLRKSARARLARRLRPGQRSS